MERYGLVLVESANASIQAPLARSELLFAYCSAVDTGNLVHAYQFLIADSTLRDVVALVQEKCVEARARDARCSLALVYPDRYVTTNGPG